MEIHNYISIRFLKLEPYKLLYLYLTLFNFNDKKRHE